MSSASLFCFFMGFTYLFLFIYTFTRKRNKIAIYFSFLCLSNSLFGFGYAFLLNSTTLEDILFFNKIIFFGRTFIPFFWFLVFYKVYFKKYSSLRTSLVMFVIPLITFFLVSTNEYHHLVYTSITAFFKNGQLVYQMIRGPWYYVYIYFSYITFFISIIAFLIDWSRARFKVKTQSFCLLIGSVVFSITSIVYILGDTEINKQLFVLGTLVFTILLLIAVFKYELLEIEDIVREITFSNINEGILVTDKKGRLIDFNNAAQKAFGWISISNIGKNIEAFNEGKIILDNGSNNFNIEVIRNNEKRHFDFYITELKENKSTFGRIYIFQDVTEQKELLDRLNYMANNDPLTDLFNRRKFIEQAQIEISRAIRYERYISTLMIDIDNFKKINDMYGHLAGDKVLITVAKECKSRIRATDIIGRYGGEEFVIILIETDMQRAYLVADNIRRRIEAMEINFNGQIIKATVSIGISTRDSSEGELSLYKLIDNADKALYSAKSNGKNLIIVHELSAAN